MRPRPIAARVTLVLALAPLLVPAGAQARLGRSVAPTRYALTLAPDLEGGTFRGEETIELVVREPTDRVTLHAVDLAIDGARGGTGLPGPAGPLSPAQVTVDAATETITVALAHPLPVGPARIALAFHGRLDDRLRGLYLARRGADRYALTQFEDTDARRAFPCFDEPEWKARFALTAIVPHGLAALSNGPVASRVPDARPGLDRVEFAETPPISSYLVALAVGRFAERTVTIPRAPAHADDARAAPLRISVWAAPDAIDGAGYALAEAARIVPALERFFDIPYPYDKLDLVAAPEFAYGGMENVACILFRESRLLVAERTATPAARRVVSLVVAHEVAHQWFGDLVTMAFWDDIWLNESFATWADEKIVDALHPTWHVLRDAIAGRGPLMAVDELPSVHAIRLPASQAEHEATAREIIYGKGAAVLRMVERFAGCEPFRRGVHDYLVRHAQANATADDFWADVGRSIAGGGGDGARDRGDAVTAMGAAWTKRPGHPLVTVSTTALRQERLLAVGEAAAGEPWPIPLCTRSLDDARPGDRLWHVDPGPAAASPPVCRRLSSAREELPKTASDRRTAAEYDNAGGTGLYRLLDTRTTPAALARRAGPRLDGAERAVLVDDARALAQMGREPIGDLLELVTALAGERDSAMLETVGRALDAVDQRLVTADLRAPFARLVRSVFAQVIARTGDAPPPREDEQGGMEIGRARAEAIRRLGLLADDPPLVAQSRTRALAYAKDPTALAPSLVDATLAVAAGRAGDETLWRALASALARATDAELRDHLLAGLGAFSAPPLVARSLALVDGQGDAGALRTDEANRLLRLLLENPASREAAFAHLLAHGAALLDRSPPNAVDNLLAGAGTLCAADRARDLEAFFAARHLPAARLLVQLAVERILACAAARERDAAPAAAWLRAH